MRRVSVAGISGSGKTFAQADTLVWHGNRELVRNMIGPREGLFAWAVRSYFRRKRELPAAVARHPDLRLIHLRSAPEVEAFLGSLAQASPAK